MFFISLLPVPAIRFRPPIVVGDQVRLPLISPPLCCNDRSDCLGGTQMFEHPHNGMYSKILQANADLVRQLTDAAKGATASVRAPLPLHPLPSCASRSPTLLTIQDAMITAMPTWLGLQDTINTLVDSQKSNSLSVRQETLVISFHIIPLLDPSASLLWISGLE